MFRRLVPQPSVFSRIPWRNAQPTSAAAGSGSAIAQQVRGYAKKKGKQPREKRIDLMHYALYHPLTPRPLKFSTLRALRHWTIQRAWNLFKHKQRMERDLELERMYNKIRDACEALKNIGDGGRLFRIATSRAGIEPWPKGVRIPTDGPARVPWSTEWNAELQIPGKK